MTLKEFSAEYMPLPDAEYGPDEAWWRKVFPTNLRWHTTVVKPARYRRNFFYTEILVSPEEVKKVLEEQWERVHKGEIIDREWRPINNR